MKRLKRLQPSKPSRQVPLRACRALTADTPTTSLPSRKRASDGLRGPVKRSRLSPGPTAARPKRTRDDLEDDASDVLQSSKRARDDISQPPKRPAGDGWESDDDIPLKMLKVNEISSTSSAASVKSIIPSVIVTLLFVTYVMLFAFILMK